MITQIRAERHKIAVVKLYLFRSQVPKASEEEIPIIFEPHIKPLARACWCTGMMSTAIPSVATSWKDPKKDTVNPAARKRKELELGWQIKNLS